MSLQVWLPLNGDLHNQGLSNLIITNNGATVDNNGKIGKCYSFDGTNDYLSFSNFNLNNWSQCSICCWVYPISSIDYLFLARGGSQHRVRISGDGFSFRDTNNTGSYRTIAFGTTIPTNTWSHLICSYNCGKITIYINGIQTVDNTTYYHSNSTLQAVVDEIRIGRQQSTSSDSYFNGKINDFRIYDHALSPKEAEEIAKGLVLHYKLDGENEILVPFGYQQLEYLESTGTQYIDTGYKPNANTIFNIKYKQIGTNASYMCPYGVTSSAQTNNANNGMYRIFGNVNRICFGTNSTDNTLKELSGYNAANTDYTISQIKNKCYINNTLIATLNTASWVAAYNLFLFTRNVAGSSSYPFSGRIYYCDIKEENSYIQKLIPARRLSDNTLGMYDAISKTFLTNAGTGVFTAGPNASIVDTIYDSSGYSHNGTIVGSLTAAAPSPRYDVATHLESSSPTTNNATGLTYIQSAFKLTTPTQMSVCWWGRPESGYNGSSGHAAWCTSANDTNPTDYDQTAFHHRDSRFNICLNSESTTSLSLTFNNYTLNEWHYYCVTYDGKIAILYKDGVETNRSTISSTDAPLKTFTNIYIGYSRAGGVYRKTLGSYSDFRVYVTALSPTQVAELYNTSMSIDSSGNIHARELVEL